MPPDEPLIDPAATQLGPFRRAVLRGLAVLLPPLLTIVIFLWVGNTVVVYLLEPLEGLARSGFIWHHEQSILTPAEVGSAPVVENGVNVDGELYRKVDDGNYVPKKFYDFVDEHRGNDPMPETAINVVKQYIDLFYLPRHVVIIVFVCVFLLVLYLLGRFIAAGVGRIFWMQFERLIHRVPLVRNVYSSVKQVTDFLFSEREVEYTRVVAVEYPRKGIWSLGMVTGESMLDIRCAANEPVMSVLVPTSPMPFTGFTVTVKKSETVDLNITIDQAFQFIVSCGVVVPPQQLTAMAEESADGTVTSGQPAVPGLATDESRSRSTTAK